MLNRQVSFTLSTEGGNGPLSNSQPAVVTVNFARKDIGRYQDRLELEFEDLQTKKRFVISRLAQAIVGDPALHQQLKAKTPYSQRRPTQREPETNVVKGVKPPALKAISYVKELPRPEIPSRLLSSLNASPPSSPRNVRAIQSTFLPRAFNEKSHGEHFKILIWIEEHRMEYVSWQFLFSAVLLIRRVLDETSSAMT